MRSVSSHWNFQRIAYLSAVSSFWRTRWPPWDTEYIFIHCTAHRNTQSGLLFCSFSLVDGQVLNLRLSAWIFHRECALPREGINLFCALRPSRSSAERDPEAVQKKCHSACIRHRRCRERCYTGREYCNPRVTSGKTGRDSSLLRNIPRTLPL